MKQLTFFCINVPRPYDPGMLPTCFHCGGTGDAWDEWEDDWANPTRKCECCDGHGEH